MVSNTCSLCEGRRVERWTCDKGHAHSKACPACRGAGLVLELDQDQKLRLASIVMELLTMRRNETQQAFDRNPLAQSLAGYVKGVADALGVEHEQVVEGVRPLLPDLPEVVYVPLRN